MTPIADPTVHRCTSQAGKTVIFRANAKFLGQMPAAKIKKIFLFVYLLNEKRIHYVLRDEVPGIRDFY